MTGVPAAEEAAATIAGPPPTPRAPEDMSAFGEVEVEEPAEITMRGVSGVMLLEEDASRVHVNACAKRH